MDDKLDITSRSKLSDVASHNNRYVAVDSHDRSLPDELCHINEEELIYML